MVDTQKLTEIAKEEFGGFSARLAMTQLIAGALPTDACPRLRMRLYRLAGITIGTGTTITGRMRLTGGHNVAQNLHIGKCCYLNDNIHFDLGGIITVQDGVSIGMQCLLITNTHSIGTSTFRAGQVSSAPVTIGAGSWLAARVTVLPGVTIGRGTVVGAGSIVVKDLPANVFAAGNPATTIKELE